jgi:hypothetical protein
MKRTYEKPWVFIEDFQLSEHIASCNWVYKQAPEGCVAEGKVEGADDLKIYLFSDAPCNLDGGASCEFTPDGVANTFAS